MNLNLGSTCSKLRLKVKPSSHEDSLAAGPSPLPQPVADPGTGGMEAR